MVLTTSSAMRFVFNFTFFVVDDFILITSLGLSMDPPIEGLDGFLTDLTILSERSGKYKLTMKCIGSCLTR